MRGPTIEHTPWTRAALPEDVWTGIGHRAIALGCHLNAVGRTPRGPWTVRAWSNDHVVEHRGWDLEAICFEALERFAAGADTRGPAWIAGSDGLAHAHVGPRPTWTLCQRPAIGEQYRHTEHARCSSCLRALDVRVAA